MKNIIVKLFDAFTDQVFCGNIAGVVTKADGLSNNEMQKIASELNAPTTGFVTTRGKNDFEVKFFTPTQEIDMCGHVVVGTFMALAEERKLDFEGYNRVDVKQHTRAGLIPIEVIYENNRPTYIMMCQNKPLFKDPQLNRTEIAKLMGISDQFMEENYPIEIAATALRHLFIPVKNLDIMGELKPDFPALAELSRKLNVETSNVFTLQTVNPGFQVHSRDFCPAIGNLEEAASGTTNGALSCYLIKNKAIPGIPRNGSIKIMAEQGYEMGRPSIIQSEIQLQDHEIKEVKVGGTAIRSLVGELVIK